MRTFTVRTFNVRTFNLRTFNVRTCSATVAKSTGHFQAEDRHRLWVSHLALTKGGLRVFGSAIVKC